MKLFLGIICFICLMGGLAIGVYNCQFLSSSKALQGTVVRIDTSYQGDSGRRHMPVIAYLDPQGTYRQFTAFVTSLNCEIGDKVWVAYHEGAQNEKLLSLGEIFLPFTVFSLFGLILLFILLPLPPSSKVTYWLLKIFWL